MVRNCVENFELKILNEFKFGWKEGWMGGWVGGWMAGGWVEKPSYDSWTWMGGWVEGSQSLVKDCLQQSKIGFRS